MIEQENLPDKQKNRLWIHPWKYGESFIVSFSLLIIGFFIEYITDNKTILLPSWPGNLVLIIIFISFVFIFHKYINHPIKRWFSSVPAAIASISVLTFLILLMGFIPQDEELVSVFVKKTGLSHVNRSWPYLLTSLNLLVILSFTIARRILPFKVKNFAFALNHAGLWIVIASASLGTADLKKLHMILPEGQLIFTATDSQNKPHNLGFGLKLLDFNIEEFPPSLGLLDNKSYRLKVKKGDKLLEVVEGTKDKLDNWNISIEKYIESAMKIVDDYILSNEAGSAPAVFVTAQNNETQRIVSGWISSGSYKSPAQFLKLNENYSIAMTIPQSKEFSSDIMIFYDMEHSEDIYIEVNKPVKVNGWKIYQTGYDEKMGRWSTISIVEIVKDPWLPIVYIGIFMILTGSLYLVWMGRSKL